MTDYTTLRVTAEAKAAAEASKREEETWNDYIRRCTDNPPEPREFVGVEDVQHLINELAATADGEGRVDSDGLAREVARQVDYGELANAVADELEARR